MIGCSSFTMETKDKKHFLSRTMDFMMEMAEQVVFVPKQKTFAVSYEARQEITSKHAFIGMGSLDDGPTGLMMQALLAPSFISPGMLHIKNKRLLVPGRFLLTKSFR